MPYENLTLASPVPFMRQFSVVGGATNLSGAFTTGPVVATDCVFELADLASQHRSALITRATLMITSADPPAEFSFGDYAAMLANGFRLWYEDDNTAKTYLTDTITSNVDAQAFWGPMRVNRFDAGITTIVFEKNYLEFSEGFLASIEANGVFGITIEEDSALGFPAIFMIALSGAALSNPERWRL